MNVPEPPPLPNIIGHRGVAGHAPENTLASIRETATMGLAWVEFDVMMTKDGELVLIHDETLDRTTDGRGRVPEMPLAALKQLDAGAWFDTRFKGERIPTLAETADLLVELGLSANIEVKPARGYARETGQAVGAFLRDEWPPGLIAPIISSFWTEALGAVSEVAPGFPRGLLVGRIPSNWTEELERLGCALLHCSQRHLRRSQAEAVLASGYRLLSYTVNDVAKARASWDWGVEAVFSDYPDRLRNIVGKPRTALGIDRETEFRSPPQDVVGFQRPSSAIIQSTSGHRAHRRNSTQDPSVCGPYR